MFWAPLVMMKMLSKIRNASSARNRTATMIAAFMFGRITLHSRCQPWRRRPCAASSMSSETCDRPASSSSDMNGVVFQISETMIANSDVPVVAEPVGRAADAGQPVEPRLTKPLLMAKANCQANAETTVMMP